MKVLFHMKVGRSWQESLKTLRSQFSAVDFITEEKGIDRNIEEAEAIVGGEVPLEVIERAKHLKIIFVPYTGINALPLDAITKRGIRIANVHANARYVAERAVAMTLSFYGKIIDYHLDLKQGKWHGYWAKGTVSDTWHSIQGRRAAVIGVGAIGTYLARFLKMFDCRVIGFKKRPVHKIPEYLDEITLDLDYAIQQSEMVFITLPLTRETRGLFSKNILSGMSGKFLVNVGRGEIVDEEGLYEALKKGILKGAGIDVWYTYPEKGIALGNPSRFPIHDLPNVILSPHLAGFTPDSAKMNIVQTVENIRSYIETGRAKSEVHTHDLY